MAVSIVQSAFARGNTSPITVTLSAAPTAGNQLIAIQAGVGQTVTAPAIFTLIESNISTPVASQGTQTWYRTVQAGDPSSFAFTGNSDWEAIAVFEVAGLAGFPPPTAGAFSGTSTTTITTGSLAAMSDASGLRLLVAEWNNSASATPPAGWTLLSPTTWQSTGNLHDAAIWQIPYNTSGTQSVAMSVAPAGSVYLDVQIATTVGPARVTQVGVEAWYVGTGTAHVTQAGVEAWYVGTGTARVTQVGVETWYDTRTLGDASTSLAEVVAYSTSPPAAGALAFADVLAGTISPPAAGALTFAELIGPAVYPPGKVGLIFAEVIGHQQGIQVPFVTVAG